MYKRHMFFLVCLYYVLILLSMFICIYTCILFYLFFVLGGVAFLQAITYARAFKPGGPEAPASFEVQASLVGPIFPPRA